MNTTNYEITDEEADYMTKALQVTTPEFHEMSKYTVTTEDELSWLIQFCTDDIRETIVGNIIAPSKVVIIHDDVHKKTYLLNPDEAKQMINAHMDELLS